MSEKYKIRDQERCYFVTFAVVEWIDVFTRRIYKELLVDSLKYCQKEKGLEIFAWCIMTNHAHLIVRSDGSNQLENIIRDFKKYTSVQIIKEITENNQESRKKWLLWMFSKKAETSKKHQKYWFWQNEYHPIELSDSKMMDQKLNYLHMNPVEAGLVDNPEEYVYSSARDYAGNKGLVDIKFLE